MNKIRTGFILFYESCLLKLGDKGVADRGRLSARQSCQLVYVRNRVSELFNALVTLTYSITK